jgi:putative DNA primase/helicase
MGLKAEFGNESGYDLFDAWSRSAGDVYDAKAARATWRSIKPGGGVTIGSVLQMAKLQGFEIPKDSIPSKKPDPVALAQREREQQEARQREKTEAGAAQEKAAAAALAYWEGLISTRPEKPTYPERKSVGDHGVRFEAATGTTVVPMCDAEGVLRNVQRILPRKPASGGLDKFYGPSCVRGGRKAGLMHAIGIDLATDDTAPVVMLLAEGYATACSLHEATEYPVVLGFDAGNLLPVAKALRKRFPAALLVVCGDDDVQTFSRTGKNPGREAAEAAARAVRGVAVFPQGLGDHGSDFNDLHISDGLEAVRTTVQAAIDVHQTCHAPAQAAQSDDGRGRAQSGGREAAAGAFDRFYVDDEGVWFSPPNDDGGPPRRICGPLRVVGLARDVHDNQAALLLEFDTPFRSNRRWLMPLAMLSGDGAAYRSALLSLGFMTPTDAKRRGWLTEYLHSRKPAELVRHVQRSGWHGRCYVLPDETLGSNLDGERVIFHSETGVEANFRQRGDLELWKRDLARLCVGNSRAAFAVSVAFAGPLLAWAPGTTGGGFHLVGLTSIGKTSFFLIAASVWGKGTENDPEAYLQKWRATSNGLEFQAEQHSDCTLILDDLGQMETGDAGASAYMLADGQGKTRGRGAGGLRPKPTWRLLYLSSGEISLAQQMEAIGKKMKGGQEVRLIPIPAEVAPGTALETTHEFDSGHELSNHVKLHAARCYGTAGRAWLEYLVGHVDGLTAKLRDRIEAIEELLVHANAVGQVKRAARRFALVAAAGEMAREAGLVDWPMGEAIRAAQSCFTAWIGSRGGSGSSETTAMLRQVRNFLEVHGEGRFSMWHRGADDHAPKTLMRAGVRRMLNAQGEPIKTNGQHNVEFGDRMPAAMGETISYEYFVLPDVFKAEVCLGYDPQAVCRVLVEHKILITDEPSRFTIKTRLPGIGQARCYRIAPAIFELDL